MGPCEDPPSLNVENVLEVVRKVSKSKWREWDETNQIAVTRDGFDFRKELGIPAEKMESIAKKHRSLHGPHGRICAGSTWWLKNHQQASWRKVVWALDAVQERKLAKKIRHYAEPPRELSLTVDNVRSILEMVKHPVRHSEGVATSLNIPAIEQHHISMMDKSKRGQAVSEYWRNTVPGASWEMLAIALYENNELSALEEVKKYLPQISKIEDATLTHHNVMEVVRQVRRGRLMDVLNLPTSQRKQIEERYHNGTEFQQIEAAVSTYLLSHPCPSWPLLTACLRHWHVGYPTSVPEEAVKAATTYMKAHLNDQIGGTKGYECHRNVCVGVLVVVSVVCGTVMALVVFGFLPLDLSSTTGGSLIDSNHTSTRYQDMSRTPYVPILPSPTPDQTCRLPGCEDILEKAPEPKYIDLITWKDGNKTGEFRLIDQIRGKCDRISTQFKVAKAVYDGWVKKDPESACHELIQHWLESGRGPYPVTWNGFIQVLKDVELGEVAKRLKDALLKI